MALAQQNRNSVFMNEEAIAGSVIELKDHIINNVNGHNNNINNNYNSNFKNNNNNKNIKNPANPVK